MIVRVRVVLRRTVVGNSGSLMFQELHKRKVKSLRQSTSTKLILCKLIGQIPLVLLAVRRVDRFLCCVNMSCVGRFVWRRWVTLWAYGLSTITYDHTNGQVIRAVIFLMSKINSYGAFILKDPVSTS